MKSTVCLVLEIHCRVGDTVAKALSEVGRNAEASATNDYASVWISPPEQQVVTPQDTLEQLGMVRVYGLSPIHDAEMSREKLSFVHSRAGCDVTFDVTVDD